MSQLDVTTFHQELWHCGSGLERSSGTAGLRASAADGCELQTIPEITIDWIDGGFRTWGYPKWMVYKGKLPDVPKLCGLVVGTWFLWTLRGTKTSPIPNHLWSTQQYEYRFLNWGHVQPLDTNWAPAKMDCETIHFAKSGPPLVSECDWGRFADLISDASGHLAQIARSGELQEA